MGTKELNQSEKAAILLMTFGEDVASEIFKSLDTNEIKRIAQAMQNIDRVDEETVNEIVEEFRSGLTRVDTSVNGGPSFMKNVLAKAFNETDGTSVADQLGIEHPPILESLKYLEPKPLASFLRNEHPQTIAVVLAHMEAKTMGETLKILPESSHTGLLLRLANLEAIDPEVLHEIEESLQKEVQNQSQSYNVGGIEKVAEMLGQLEGVAAEKMLLDIEERDAAMAEELRRMMFGFEDLLKIDSAGMQLIIKSSNNNTIKMSLKGAKQHVANHFFDNMSDRAAETLQDDLANMPKVRVTEVEEARRQIIELARRLESSGELELRSSDEVYV